MALKMTLKLLIFLTTCVFIVRANDRDDTEAFITKEAAEELKNKFSSSSAVGVAKNEQLDDYDEVLKDMIRVFENRQKSNQQQFYFEKKYFDYLPNDIHDTEVDSLNEELNSEAINPSSGGGSGISIDDEESVGAKRAKRDVEAAYQSRTFNNNPWTPQSSPSFRFHPPGNFYLPPSSQPTPRPPPTYLPPSQTNRQPVNVPQPPHNNYLPPTTKMDEFPNRVSGYESAEDPYVFDVRPLFNNNNNQIQGQNHRKSWKGGISNIYESAHTTAHPPPQYQTRPPQYQTPPPQYQPPPLIINLPDEEIEIEYAPEIPDDADVSTTTRASIQRPTRRNKNQQQNHGRQKKSDSESMATMEETTTSTTESANTSQQDFSAASHNNRKPNKPLSPCVEAIVNCCSRYDEIVRVPCFEAHNCNGAFFGPSPCSREIRQAALREVEKYSEAK